MRFLSSVHTAIESLRSRFYAGHKEQLEANLIEQYQSFSERPLFKESIEFLDRGASKQPITNVHHRNLTSSNRVLVIAMDDSARVLATEMENAVMIGFPIADQISNLTPPTSDTAVKDPRNG